MAKTSSIVYCNDRDISDIYPRISEYDYKTRLPSKWTKSGNKYTLEHFKFISDEVALSGADRIIQLYADGKDLGEPEEDLGQLNRNDEWVMLLYTFKMVYYNDSKSPNDMIMELGENRTDLMLRFRKKASRIIEAILGFSITREIMKDREGKYPTSIIQATALKTALLILKAYNPNGDDIVSLEAEFDDIINKILSGKIVMSGHRTGDDSKGIIREISVNAFSALKPLELIGNYQGSDYELLKIIVDSSSGLGIGASTYSVYGKSSTSLKTTQIVKSKIINGDYQETGVDNLLMRWGGARAGTTSFNFENDEYEIELWGSSIQPTRTQIKSILASKVRG